ncbi:hypothetical protein IKN40_01030 [bacterium]|nr:hypothetical protein [bacterium]
MTQEEKQLLLKDLCARLPYKVKIEITWWVMDEGTCMNTTLEPDHIDQLLNDEDGDAEIKPYLRPMSSMTEEECNMVEEILGDKCIFDFMSNGDIILKQGQFSQNKLAKLYDYYNSIHLDYRGLIERGLALKALEGMYK